MRVLLLHDNIRVQTILTSLLTRFGCTAATCVESCDQAWTAFATLGADLIVVDVMLEGETGLDFVKRVRRDPASPQRTAPIVVVTASEDPAVRVAARDAGADEFTVLPADPAALSSAVAAALEQPRPFVEAEAFSGPDRRTTAAVFAGPDRRSLSADGETARVRT